MLVLTADRRWAGLGHKAGQSWPARQPGAPRVPAGQLLIIHPPPPFRIRGWRCPGRRYTSSSTSWTPPITARWRLRSTSRSGSCEHCVCALCVCVVWGYGVYLWCVFIVCVYCVCVHCVCTVCVNCVCALCVCYVFVHCVRAWCVCSLTSGQVWASVVSY